ISMGGRELARYAYTKRGYLMEAHSFQFGSLFYQYNARAFITSWRDTKATRVHYVYDGDRVTEIYSDTGQMSARLSYDDTNRVTRVIDAKGAVQTFHHNGRGLVWRRIDARGGEWITERNFARKITATIDALGRRTSYSYNEMGLLTSKVSPSG